MERIISNKFFAAAFALSVICLVVWAKPREDSSADAKARFLRLAAIQKSAEGKYDEAHELYKRAFGMNPSDNMAAYYYAMGELSIPADSMGHYHDVLRLMRPYVDANPDDYNEARFYAMTAAQLHDYGESNRVLERLDTLFPGKNELLVGLAENYTALGETNRAVDYYNRYEKAEGVSPPLSLRKIFLHLNDRDTVAALGEADALIAANRRDADYYILKGNVLEYLAMPDSALAYYQQAEEVAPNSGAAKMALAGYYHDQGDSTAYDAKIYEALLCEDFELDNKLDLLAKYIQPLLENKSSTVHADYLLTVLGEQYPHEPRIRDFAARYNAAKGDWSEAAEQISYAIDQDPDNDGYVTQLMTYYLAAQRYDDAVALFSASEKKGEPSMPMMYFAASALSLLERNREVVDLADRMIKKITPELSVAEVVEVDSLPDLSQEEALMLASTYSLAGDTYYKMHDTASAYRSYDNALLFDPENPSTLNNYAYFLSEENDPTVLDKAMEMSKKAITAEPTNPVYLDTFAWILFKKRDYEAALEYQNKAVENTESDDMSYDMLEHLGDILFMCGQPQEALAEWEKALKLNPSREILQRKVKNKTYFYE